MKSAKTHWLFKAGCLKSVVGMILMGAPGTNSLLLELKDENANVRRAAVLALMEIKSDQIVEPLLETLNDSDVTVRKAAIVALSELKTKRVVEPLIGICEGGQRLSSA